MEIKQILHKSLFKRALTNGIHSLLLKRDDARESADVIYLIQGGPKSKPLPNDKKVVLNRIKACQ